MMGGFMDGEGEGAEGGENFDKMTDALLS